MFARVITAQTTPDGFDGFIRFAQEQLPGTQAQPGFKGCYLLTDRDTGNLVTISLWDTPEASGHSKPTPRSLTSAIQH